MSVTRQTTLEGHYLTPRRLRLRMPFKGLTRHQKKLSDLKKVRTNTAFNSRPSRMDRVTSRPKALVRWLYSVSFFIFIGLLLGLSAVMPIDIIIQSTDTSSRLAVNTIIIIGACALFLLLSFVFYVVRLLIVRTHMQDIPKPYIPTTPEDISVSASERIRKEFIRCQRIRKMAAPRGRIMHRGLFHSYEGPSSESSSLQVKLPNNLVYENVVHSIGEDIKYRKMLSINDSLQLKTEGKATLREVLLHKYGLMKQELTDKDISTLYDFLIHYERVRFSGIPIAYDEFVIFMGLWSRVKNDIWKYKKV